MEAGFIALLMSWCPTAVSGVLIFLVSYLIKKSKDDSVKNAERAESLRAEINATLNNFGERLTKVEHDYVKNEFFLRELSGWKTEINRLSDLINTNFMTFTQHIITFLTKGIK